MNPLIARTVEELPTRFNAATDLLAPNLVAGRGGKVAVIDHNGATTYAELASRVDKMADVFRNIGVRLEQRILLCLLDTVDFPTVFLGAVKAGIVPIPISTLLSADDYAWILDDSGASAVFVSGECVGRWSEIAEARPAVRFISVGNSPWPSLDSLLNTAVPIEIAADTYRDEVAFWLYTSGSTGRPKGAMHAHSSMRLTTNLFGISVIGLCEEDIMLSVSKQFFAYGLGNALTFPFAVGATAVLHKDRPTPESISRLIENHRVTVLGGVPTFFANWLARDDVPTKADLPQLRIALSAGEALPSRIGQDFRERYGIDIIDGLGSTEMLHVYLSQRPGEVRHGYTGQPVPGYELRIVDENGVQVGIGELGELQVKGPTAALGYWRNRPKTVSTFLGEWTRTGDTYCCDSDGWYQYGGRSDDMLKVGGIYVAPGEVEDALTAHPYVLEAAVVGKADEAGLIKPCAHVVLKPGGRGDAEMEAALKAHVKSRLAPHKSPKWIVFSDTLPRTSTDKIQRFRLRKSA
jgi:benzoate-CoA ligase